jgi:hypothetical protein
MRLIPALPLAATLLVTVAVPTFAAKPSKAERRDMKGDAVAASSKPSPQDAQARVLTKLREQLEVTDDAEWDVIGERILKVNELRQTVAAGAAGAKTAMAMSEKSKRSSRGSSAHPEQDALRSAVVDKLPDAEIKMRLARAHDVHQRNLAKLAKAQDELRAVLTVRQEAVAVIAGLLPP